VSISSASNTTTTIKRYRYVAVGGETSLSGVDANGNVLSYTPGIEQVFLNGVLQVRTSDYTATTGTSITGLTALVANDIVEIVTFAAFTVATALGAAQDSAPLAPVEGQVWLATSGVSPSYQQLRWSKTVGAGVTSLTGLDDSSVTLAYSAGYENVYLNGTLLSRGNDYTATDGATITLTSATLASDLVEIFSNNTITSFANNITNSQYANTGDILYASASSTPARLAVGSTGQVLTVSGGIPIWSGTASLNEQVFNANGTWTAPTGVTKAWVTIVSGGGGGGAASSTNGAGIGGAGGAQYTGQFTVVPATGYTVTIGGGGAGATALGGNVQGSAGSASVFGSTTIAGGLEGRAGGGSQGYIFTTPGQSSFGIGGTAGGGSATGGSAAANSGGGGGGAQAGSATTTTGGTGGSGIVIVRWLA
jgi:hypothetical protein